MSIRVTCSCGKSFAAPENLAGKTVPCPACRAPIHIHAAPSPTTMRVTCSCGTTLNAKAEHAGKKAKCPQCGALLMIPAPDVLDSNDPFATGAALADDPLGLGTFDEKSPAAKPQPLRHKPSKQSAKNNKALVIGLSIGGAGVAVIILLVVIFAVVLPAMRSDTQTANNSADNATANSGPPRTSTAEQSVPANTNAATSPVADDVSSASTVSSNVNASAPPTNSSFPQGNSAAPVANAFRPTDVPKEWITFTSPDDFYTVQFPREPQTKRQDFSGAILSQAQITDGQTTYYVIATHTAPAAYESPSFDIERSLEASIRFDIKSNNGQLLSDKKIESNGRAGREITFSGTSSNGLPISAVARYFAVDKMVYAVMVSGPDRPEADVQRFFDSFQVTFEGSPAS